jgi:3-methyladenine DNA glycosylase AlkD
MTNVARARKRLRQYASPQKATLLQGFFKTRPGEYGEGDIFIGVKVPEIRTVANDLARFPIRDTLTLLGSKIHEERLLALFLLIRIYQSGKATDKDRIVSVYLKNTRCINNWDLVDLSSPKILGDWLKDRDRRILKKLAQSASMWERRIAIVATYAFIREKDFSDTLSIADMLITDTEDLMHKATGWMLREVGKRDVKILENFLKPRCKSMPRTMLRYAIERFPESKRQGYLKGKV